MNTQNESRISVSGELTMLTVSSIYADKVRHSSDQQSSGNLVIDFSGVTKADSSAVALMLAWMRDGKKRQAAVRFVNVPDAMKNLLRLYEVSEYFEF